MADKGFQDRMRAYKQAFDESEKHFESEIEKYLISPEAGGLRRMIPVIVMTCIEAWRWTLLH